METEDLPLLQLKVTLHYQPIHLHTRPPVEVKRMTFVMAGIHIKRKE